MASPLPMDMVSVTSDTPDLDMESVKLKLSQRLMLNTSLHTVLDTPDHLPTPPMDMDSVTSDTPDSDIMVKLTSPIMAATPNYQALCIKLPLEMFSVLKWRNLHYLGKL